MTAAELQLPPGFRFHPTDEELVTHYLCRKCTSQPIAVPIVAEIDLYKFDPWDLPGKLVFVSTEQLKISEIQMDLNFFVCVLCFRFGIVWRKGVVLLFTSRSEVSEWFTT